MDCLAFCTASSYQIKPFFDRFRTQGATLYRDVIHLPVGEQDGSDAFFFSYGVVVFWGLSVEQCQTLLDQAKVYEERPLPPEEIETDEFTFIYGDVPKLFEDEIILPKHDVLDLLAVSHGIAQSVKLGTFENAIRKTFNHTKYIPEELAKQGKVSLSRKEIRRKMGELFIERNSINLHLDILDTPEFFWENAEVEPLYKMTSNYLDVETRVEVLNHRLDVVHELFEMLGNELNHQHSSRLEWTIIWLIIVEVALTLLKDVFHVL